MLSNRLSDTSLCGCKCVSYGSIWPDSFLDRPPPTRQWCRLCLSRCSTHHFFLFIFWGLGRGSSQLSSLFHDLFLLIQFPDWRLTHCVVIVDVTVKDRSQSPSVFFVLGTADIDNALPVTDISKSLKCAPQRTNQKWPFWNGFAVFCFFRVSIKQIHLRCNNRRQNSPPCLEYFMDREMGGDILTMGAGHSNLSAQLPDCDLNRKSRPEVIYFEPLWSLNVISRHIFWLQARENG